MIYQKREDRGRRLTYIDKKHYQDEQSAQEDLKEANAMNIKTFAILEPTTNEVDVYYFFRQYK